jgi:hypothetical protein
VADVAETIAALTVMQGRFEEAMKDTVAAVLEDLRVKGEYFAPVGVDGNATDPPGTLAASIIPTPVTGGGGIYTGEVGPTTVYGRQRELGGPITPVYAEKLKFRIFGFRIETDYVYQRPQPYMKVARMTEDAAAIRITDEKMTAVILGG